MEKKQKRASIRTRLIIVPLLVVFVVIVATGFLSSYFLRTSLMNQVEVDGEFLVKNLLENIQDNYRALLTINDQLDKQMAISTRMAMAGEQDNSYLKGLAKDLEVKEISWYDRTGTIVNSNLEDNIGWQAGPDHPISEFMKSGDQFMIEDIRQDNISGDYFKFAYLKRMDGYFVQVGVLANDIQQLTDNFDHQKFLEDLVQEEELVYALFTDREGRITGHNIIGKIGELLTDEGSLKASVEGVSHIQDWYYEDEDVEVMDISYPILLDGEHLGECL